jgi:hypothetical protein
MPKSKDDVRASIIAELKSHPKLAFLAAAPDAEIYALLGHKDVMPIYEDIKSRLNAANTVPDAMAESGITADMWQYVNSVRESRTDARKQHAIATTQLAADYKAKLKMADDELADALTRTETPIVTIVEAGVDALPANAVFKLNAIKDKKARATAESDALVIYRKAMLAKIYSGNKFSASTEAQR